MQQSREYQIYVLTIEPPVEISLTHPTTEQEQLLWSIEKTAFNEHKSRLISPSEGFRDITPSDMAEDKKVAVVANDEGGGTVVITSKKSALRRGFERIFNIGDSGNAPRIETFTLPPYDRVPIGILSAEFSEPQHLGEGEFPRQIGEKMTVRKLVVRRDRRNH